MEGNVDTSAITKRFGECCFGLKNEKILLDFATSKPLDIANKVMLVAVLESYGELEKPYEMKIFIQRLSHPTAELFPGNNHSALFH